MLFVFQVDTGRMMKFDMSLALESVQTLKTYVEEACNIPVDKQVLLISGGEHLNPEARVCSYPAGTDTNPIFLFSKAVIESNQPPAASVDYGSEHDLTSKVKESAELPATYTTVQKRTQLAQLFYEVGKSQVVVCERLVHEQHLQQQGWSAVVANLEDLNADLKHRWKLYQEAFNEYITKRDSYLQFLNHFKDDLLVLQKIPVLPALIDSQKLLVPEQDDFTVDKQSESVRDEMTLLDWISQRDDFMDCLYDICSKGLSQTDEKVFAQLHDEVQAKLEMTDDLTMKEIKGLGDRLFGLEKLMLDAKNCVNDQMELAKAFVRNQSRASQFKEASVLPDLCATHLQQLNVLLENHNRLRDITRRCIRAKDELSSNLYHRLKWIVFMEDNLSELDNKLVFNFENLLSLQRQLEILQQVHTAPATYLSAVAEVVRRRSFSQSFLLWASDVACHLLTIHNEELSRRKEFQSQFEGHFLSSLFPGMEDFPPSFATQAPSIFDSGLPKLSDEDVERLKRELPELAENLNIPDNTAVTNFFILKDGKDDIDKINVNKAVEDKLMEVVTEAGLATNEDQNLLKAIEGEQPQTTPHGLPHLKDLDKGCESETDTEEFEKVGQSPFDLHFDKGIPSSRPGTQDASTLTEDNLQISRSEYEKLRSVLIRLSQLARQTHHQLRSELNEVKNHLLRERVLIEEACGNLTININNVVVERDNRAREMIQRITVDHELEISDFRKIAQGKNEEIKCLRDENASLGSELKKITNENTQLKERLDEITVASNREMEELKKRIGDMQIDKEKCIKEVTDRLKCEHRGEIESIRARFKLMTMERSPSENSLEKIERGDYSSITNPEALLIQMTENFESEKEVAVSDAVNKESQKWQKILDDRIKEMEREFEQQRAFLIEDIQNSLPKEKDKQIDKLREQINNMNLECMKYKNTIQQLTEYKEESDQSELLQKIDTLEKEKAALEAELEKYRVLNESGMAASVAVCEGVGTSDAATSPMKSKRRSEALGGRTGKLSIDSCKQGDLVLVVWDMTFQNFKILQESSYMYFLNTDCMDSLGLKVIEGQPNKLYCYAEVIEKEYCHARKPVNRFRVPKGTKFFRVKVKPPPSSKEVPPNFQPISALQQSHMSQSQTTASPAMDIVMAEGPSHSLPSSPTKSGQWEKSVEQNEESAIPEETGEDSVTSENPEEGARNDEDIEKGTELTENFNVEIHTSIDRIEEN